MSLNLKELFAGNGVKAEIPTAKPVGRPKKRPKDIEVVVKQELPDIDKEIQHLVKPKPTFEIDDASWIASMNALRKMHNVRMWTKTLRQHLW